MKNKILKVIIFLLIALSVSLFFIFDLHHFFTLEEIKLRQSQFVEFYQKNQVLTLGGYFLIYVAVTALSLPGAAVMTLLAGALFGTVTGTILVSFASTTGATLAFLIARFLFQDYVQNRFGKSLETINEGVRKEGAFYLFTLRLVPVFPFFLINLAMALTPIKPLVFFLVSQVGMLAGTIVYVYAGSQLAGIESMGDILSFELILAFSMLGLFPLVAKKVVDFIRSRRAPQNPS